MRARRLATAGAVGVAAIAGAVVGAQALTGTSNVTLNPGDSWQAAYVAASPGDTIKLAAGTHPAQVLLADPTKISPDDVVFEPVAGAVVTVDGALFLGRSGSTTAAPGASHVTFRDLRVKGVVATTPGTDDVTFERIDAGYLNISGSSTLGVKVLGGDYGPWTDSVSHIKQGAQNVLIDSAVFHDFLISNADKHAECLMIWGGAGRTTIRNTVFRNCTDFGLLVKSPRAQEIIIERSFFEAPMLGNVATTTCTPGCPRGGNSVRFSGVTETYAGSAIRDNIVNGGIGVDCNCIPRTNNAPGVVPLVPPGTPEPPPATTGTTPTETEPPPMSTYADDFQRASLGSNWQTPTPAQAGIIAGDFGIVSGRFVLGVWAGAVPADQFSEGVISGGMSPSELARGVFVRRRASDGARYQFHYDYNGSDTDPRPQWQIKYDGVPTAETRFLAVVLQPVPQAGDVIRIEVQGSEIRGYLNGQLLLTATDTVLTSGAAGIGTKAKVTVTNQGAFARWAGGELAAQPPPPPPTDSLPLTIVSQDATTVTVGWTPVAGLGYRFLSDGKIVSHTWDANRSSTRFSKTAGAVLRVESIQLGPFGTIGSP